MGARSRELKEEMFKPTAALGLLLASAVSSARADSPARGFGDEIEWYSYSDGLAKAAETGKPLMVILHKTWCGACKRLKPEFAGSAEIRELSSNFVMVNAEDDESPHADKSFQIDGGYIPRIFFLSSDGEIKSELYNAAGNPQYKYYYASASQVVTAMEEAQAALSA